MKRRRLATAAALAAGLGALASPDAGAGPTAADGPVVTAVRVDWDVSLASLVGAETTGTVTASIRNEGATRVRHRVAVELDGQISRSRPLVLDPGHEVGVELDLVAAAPSWGRHAIDVRYGRSGRAMSSWQVPWLLIASAAGVLHLVMLGARDRLRRWLSSRAEGGPGSNLVRPASG